MTEPDAITGPSGGRRVAWRLGSALVLATGAVLVVVSAQNADGTDLRPGRYGDLASVVSNESDRYAALQQRVSDLNEDVAELAESVDDADVRRYQREVARLEDPAGLVAAAGPGVRITLQDAPGDLLDEAQADPDRDVNRLVVHQQDIQAVVNALWSGGAAAVTVQGQRVVSTTGIKCEGNAVMLQGVPYSQPYVIAAVGDVGDLTTAVSDSAYLAQYREDAADTDIDVGWEFEVEDEVEAPAYDGLLGLSYAEPLSAE